MNQTYEKRMPEPVTMTTAILVLSPVVSGSAIALNVLYSTWGRSTSVIIWKRLYGSSSRRVIFQESGRQQFLYLLANLSVLQNRKSWHLRQVSLSPEFQTLLEKSPLKTAFSGKSFLEIPLGPFYVKSVQCNGSWVWLKVYPLTADGVTLSGFEFWTYSWDCTNSYDKHLSQSLKEWQTVPK